MPRKRFALEIKGGPNCILIKVLTLAHLIGADEAAQTDAGEDVMGCLCQAASWPSWNFIREIKADILTRGHCRKLHYTLFPIH